MRKLVLLCCVILLSLEAYCQTAPDRIYLMDSQIMQVWVDEIGEQEIMYFSNGNPPRQTLKISRSLVWKVVFANGDTELIQAFSLPANTSPAANPKPAPTASPVVEVPDLIHTVDHTIIEGRVVRIAGEEVSYLPVRQDTPQTYPLHRIQKIVYADGRTERFDQPKPTFGTLAREPAPDREVKKPVRPKSKRYLGLVAGGLATTFYRDTYYPLPEEMLLNWEAGLVGSLVSTRFYQARVELLYTNKGAIENFSTGSLTARSENRLTYVQGNALPLILKTGSSRLNFALGAGGYYAYLLQKSSRYALGDGELEEDDISREMFDVPTDYGVVALAGMYYRHKPVLEVRYTHGMAPLMRQAPIRMQGVHVSLFLIF